MHLYRSQPPAAHITAALLAALHLCISESTLIIADSHMLSPLLLTPSFSPTPSGSLALELEESGSQQPEDGGE
ncbi:hypothetical protein CgunFtcFv8_020301 [Champsocephalus gunnari]|uniref:Secreted protein n=1 Tax=Champsocephalus gunnari TaxID=52237 RepID=A0AAN8E8F3_CHAGU|nr:hypothetical protein CgunFtcFv8_020301 [Champsocephalus gunnari]